jgi:hypothetical protein
VLPLVLMRAMPTGDTPEKAQSYYRFLQSHHETNGEVKSWHVLWDSLGWEWGFAAALIVGFVLWIVQYRSTHRRAGLYPVDRWAGYTAESARPGATMYFVFATALFLGISIAIVVGHLVWGQTF